MLKNLTWIPCWSHPGCTGSPCVLKSLLDTKKKSRKENTSKQEVTSVNCKLHLGCIWLQLGGILKPAEAIDVVDCRLVQSGKWPPSSLTKFLLVQHRALSHESQLEKYCSSLIHLWKKNELGQYGSVKHLTPAICCLNPAKQGIGVSESDSLIQLVSCFLSYLQPTDCLKKTLIIKLLEIF